MDRFDKQYILLEALYEDPYYPDFLLDKIKLLEQDFINYVEDNPTGISDVANHVYDVIVNAAQLQDEFLDNESEFDSLARERLIQDLEYIVNWYHLPIKVEEVLSQREWE